MAMLLPQPKSVVYAENFFSITLESHIVRPAGSGQMVQTASHQLRDEVQTACGFAPMLTCGSSRAGDIVLAISKEIGTGYRLTISEDGATVVGCDEANVLHGVQTLRQIIRQSGWILPGMTVEDKPDFAVRGFYHDQTRGRVGTLAWLKQLAEKACFYKLNQLQLYVEHTYLFRDIPELWSTAVTPLTPGDILELDEYCAARGVELVPSLSSFGHLLELLRTKRFSPLCELEDAAEYPSSMLHRMQHHTIDPTDARSFSLIAAMIDEYMALFRSNKFNICCDETFDLGKGKNKGKNASELYMDFLKKLCVHVEKQGKTPMFWGDIILKYPDALKDLPEGAVCLNWCYDTIVAENGTRAFAEAGAVQYVCPGVQSWDRLMPHMDDAYANISQMADHGRKYGAVGILNTDWGDAGHVSDPRLSIPGLITGACASWGQLPPKNELWETVSVIEYGDRSGKCAAIVAEISDCLVYRWWDMVCYKEGQQGVTERKELSEKAIAPAAARLRKAEVELKTCCKQMDECQRPMVRLWMSVLEATLIWNRVGLAVSRGQKDCDLAMQLERWLHRYETMWREVSKESELWRIRDVAAWYADLLR